MYGSHPVPIPESNGKIVIRKRGGNEYILYETGRRYDRARKINIPERRMIGIRIPSLPGMMLPNMNYRLYCREEEKMNEEQERAAEIYEQEQPRYMTLRELFDQMYYEFQIQSRRKPDEKVNEYKARKINSILEPLREIMAGEEYAQFLDLVEEDDGESGGKTYSDVALLLTQYKGALKRFFFRER